MPDVTLIAICVGYALYNAVRKTLPVALPLLMNALDLDKVEVGLISSNFALAYGLSKFGSSIISDYVNCKNLLSIGLFCTALTSLMFPFLGSSVTVLSAVWFINGLAQGVGWPSISKIIFLTYSPEQRGSAWSAASTAGNLGLILGSVLYPALLYYGWQTPFVVSGILGILIATFLTVTLRVPCDDKVTTNNDTSGRSSFHSDSNNFNTSWMECMLSIPLLCLFSGNMCGFFLQRGFSDWAGLFFIEKIGLSSNHAYTLVFLYEVGGVLGSLGCGILSDMSIVGYRKDLTCFIFSLVLLPVYFALFYATWNSTNYLHYEENVQYNFLLSVGVLLLGVGSSGPKTLLGLMVRNFVPATYIGLSGGLLGFTGQVGGALAGSGLGTLLQTHGWGCFIPILFFGAASCSASLLLFISYESNGRISTDREYSNKKND